MSYSIIVIKRCTAIFDHPKSTNLNYNSKERNECMRTNLIENDYWIKSTTLGTANEFLWRLSNDNCLHIKRKFGEVQFENYKIINEEELEKINIFVKHNEWTDLANSVSKLHDGT